MQTLNIPISPSKGTSGEAEPPCPPMPFIFSFVFTTQRGVVTRTFTTPEIKKKRMLSDFYQHNHRLKYNYDLALKISKWLDIFETN